MDTEKVYNACREILDALNRRDLLGAFDVGIDDMNQDAQKLTPPIPDMSRLKCQHMIGFMLDVARGNR